MWYKIGSRKRYNNEALEIDIMKSSKNVFFLDAPSFCGKTYFLKHLNVGVIICPCRQFIEESLMAIMTENIRREDMLKKLQTECAGKIIALEDVDYSLEGRLSTQGELAFFVALLSQTNKVILTGIDLRMKCRSLMKHIECVPYEYYCLASDSEGDFEPAKKVRIQKRYRRISSNKLPF